MTISNDELSLLSGYAPDRVNRGLDRLASALSKPAPSREAEAAERLRRLMNNAAVFEDEELCS